MWRSQQGLHFISEVFYSAANVASDLMERLVVIVHGVNKCVITSVIVHTPHLIALKSSRTKSDSLQRPQECSLRLSFETLVSCGIFADFHLLLGLLKPVSELTSNRDTIIQTRV